VAFAGSELKMIISFAEAEAARILVKVELP